MEKELRDTDEHLQLLSKNKSHLPGPPWPDNPGRLKEELLGGHGSVSGAEGLGLNIQIKNLSLLQIKSWHKKASCLQ